MAENYKVADDFKATVKLFSGKEIVIDLMKVSYADFKQIIKPGTEEEIEYAILSKATGMKVEELANMAQPDYRLLTETFVKISTQPLSNPT